MGYQDLTFWHPFKKVMKMTNEVPKRVKKPWLEPSVGDIVSLDKEKPSYAGLIVDVERASTDDLISEHQYDILWIKDGRVTRESSSRIRKSYVLLENEPVEK